MKFKFFLALVGASLLIATSASSQSTALVNAAKKEGGKVIVYGSLESDTMAAITKAFQKKTGIEVEYWRRADRCRPVAFPMENPMRRKGTS